MRGNVQVSGRGSGREGGTAEKWGRSRLGACEGLAQHQAGRTGGSVSEEKMISKSLGQEGTQGWEDWLVEALKQGTNSLFLPSEQQGKLQMPSEERSQGSWQSWSLCRLILLDLTASTLLQELCSRALA